MKRSMLLITGWLGAAVLFLSALQWLEWSWNLFSWRFNMDLLDLNAVACAAGILLALSAIWFLAKATRDRVTWGVSALLCLAFVGIAIAKFPAEAVSQAGNFGARGEASPLWYRGGRVLLMCLPAVFWLYWRWRDRAHQPHAHDRSPLT